MKNALLIISHGSRRTASNEEVCALTTRIRELTSERIVECAFLEMAEPTIQQKIDELAATGATDIQVFPHFLAAGMHVTGDIPREIKIAQNKYPGITFHQLPHLGALSEVPELIFREIRSNK